MADPVACLLSVQILKYKTLSDKYSLTGNVRTNCYEYFSLRSVELCRAVAIFYLHTTFLGITRSHQASIDGCDGSFCGASGSGSRLDLGARYWLRKSGNYLIYISSAQQIVR